MSNYENYSATAAHYDTTRAAIGYEIILGMICAAPGRLHEHVVLDAGCGTGNYAAALAPYVGRIEAVDANRDMLAVARAKLASLGADAQTNFHVASIDALPLDTGSVDAAMVNQVLHHLPVTAGWRAHKAVLQELARVLRGGGLLSINTCSPTQLASGFWYYHLAPRAHADVQRRHLPLEDLESLLAAAGFETLRRVVPTSVVLQGEAYKDSLGPLRDDWRRGDSFWALCSAQELRAALTRLRELDAAGELDAFVAENDRERLAIGQTTFVFAEKVRNATY